MDMFCHHPAVVAKNGLRGRAFERVEASNHLGGRFAGATPKASGPNCWKPFAELHSIGAFMGNPDLERNKRYIRQPVSSPTSWGTNYESVVCTMRSCSAIPFDVGRRDLAGCGKYWGERCTEVTRSGATG